MRQSDFLENTLHFTLKLVGLTSLGIVLVSCQSQPRFSVRALSTNIGGQPVVSLSQPPSGNQPQILSAQILPGRGMNTFQLRARLPGKGDIDMLVSPPLEEAQKLMNGGPDDFNGNQSFEMGGAILLPFANRIRGTLAPDQKTLRTTILGKEVTLPANWIGKLPTAQRHAMHGLILASPFGDLKMEATNDHAVVTGSHHAGDFQGHWLSQTQVEAGATLTPTSFSIGVTAKNVGNEDLPIGIGWHPYFALPSGDRAQARLHLPARKRTLVNNYDDVFPTGEVVAVKGTPYDFTASGGAPLGQLFLDDCFFDLERTPNGRMVAEIIDPAAKYGIRVTALSSQVKAIQVYAPVDKQMVVLEPQFNLADPYSKIWAGKVDTGMAVLKPGESLTYSVTVELFVP